MPREEKEMAKSKASGMLNAMSKAMKIRRAAEPKSGALLKKGERIKSPVNHTRSGAGDQRGTPPSSGAGGHRGDGISKKDFDAAYGRRGKK